MDLFFFACIACLCASDQVEGRALLKKTRKVLGPENFSGRFFFPGFFLGGFLGSRKAFLKEPTRLLTRVFGVVFSGL